MQDIKVEVLHMGQYRPYGDTFRVWKIETKEQDIEKIKQYCFKEIWQKELPEDSEWHRNIRSKNDKYDASYYFRGYYKLEKEEYGYKFTICEPYDD